MALSINDRIMGPSRGSVAQYVASLDRPDQKDIDFSHRLWHWCGIAGLDYAGVEAWSDVETDSKQSLRWNTDLNPGGVGIPSDSTVQPFKIADADAAARIMVQCMFSAVNGRLHPDIPIPAEATDWFARVWLPKVTHPRFPDVARWTDLDIRYDKNGDGRPESATWAWGFEEGQPATVMAARANSFWPALPDQGATPQPQPEPTPMPTPTIYDLKNDADAARFGISPAERNTLLGKRFTNRNGGEPRAIVVHIQDGNTAGSLNYWLGKDASATVMIQRDGSILRVIPEQHGPWTNGDVKSPTAASAKVRSYGGNVNNWTLSIENEGAAGQAFPDIQIAANVWQIQQWQAQYGIPDDQVIRHADINTIDKARCPGDGNYQRIKAGIAGGTTPTVPPTVPPPPAVDLPEGMDLDLAKAWFGSVKSGGVTYAFNPEGSVSQLWLTLGRFPKLSKVEKYDTRTYFRFADGTTIWRPNDAAPVKMLE